MGAPGKLVAEVNEKGAELLAALLHEAGATVGAHGAFAVWTVEI